MTATKSQLEQELDAILHGAAIAPLTGANARGFLRITGTDATRWLNGMVTNNIKDLQPGQGNYNFLLTNQGRIVGDCTIYREPGDEPTFLLETDNSQLETVHQTLDRFIIMDDVELTTGLPLDATTSDASGYALLGALRSELLSTLLSDPHGNPLPSLPAPGTFAHAVMEGCPALLLTPPAQAGGSCLLLFADDRVTQKLQTLKLVQVSPEALEAYRIFSGTPRYGTDIRNTDTAKDLPQETAQTHAINFNKGCYLGQEIVERIHSRGQVHRQFTPFTLTGQLPATLPQALEANGKTAGEITSAVAIGDTLYALGYARREALETHAPLTYPGGTAQPTQTGH